jgi:hypothetical protein
MRAKNGLNGNNNSHSIKLLIYWAPRFQSFDSHMNQNKGIKRTQRKGFRHDSIVHQTENFNIYLFFNMLMLFSIQFCIGFG